MDNTISSKLITIVEPKVDPSKLKIPDLKILGAGHLPGRTAQRKNVTFNEWAFMYIVEGKGTFQVDGNPVQQVDKGSLIFVYPGHQFHYGPENGGYWDEFHIVFDGIRLNDWLKNGWLKGYESVLHVGLSDQILSKINSVFHLLESNIPANCDRASLLLESIIFEFDELIRQKKIQHSEHVYSILDDIANTIYQPFDAKEFAARHKIGVSTLRRIVVQSTGYPLHEYVHRLKISESKNLLLNSNLLIKEIALNLGFDDTSYFSRLFKKFSNMAPDHFRNKDLTF
jgi:AraC-like DNA-binding protein